MAKSKEDIVTERPNQNPVVISIDDTEDENEGEIENDDGEDPIRITPEEFKTEASLSDKGEPAKSTVDIKDSSKKLIIESIEEPTKPIATKTRKPRAVTKKREEAKIAEEEKKIKQKAARAAAKLARAEKAKSIIDGIETEVIKSENAPIDPKPTAGSPDELLLNKEQKTVAIDISTPTDSSSTSLETKKPSRTNILNLIHTYDTPNLEELKQNPKATEILQPDGFKLDNLKNTKELASPRPILQPVKPLAIQSKHENSKNLKQSVLGSAKTIIPNNDSTNTEVGAAAALAPFTHNPPIELASQISKSAKPQEEHKKLKEPKAPKEPKVPKTSKTSKTPKEAKEPKTVKLTKESKDSVANKAENDLKRDAKDTNDSKKEIKPKKDTKRSAVKKDTDKRNITPTPEPSYTELQNQNLKQVKATSTIASPSFVELSNKTDEALNAETSEQAKDPIIVLKIPLPTKDEERGTAQVVFNVLKLTEDKYGWKNVHPNASKFTLDLINDDDMEEDDDTEGVGAPEEEEEEKEPPVKVDGRTLQKGKPKIGQYDVNDPFIDDTEMLYEEQRASTKDGFFVYYGPLVEEGKNLRIERADGTIKRSRKRVAGTTNLSYQAKKKPNITQKSAIIAQPSPKPQVEPQESGSFVEIAPAAKQ